MYSNQLQPALQNLLCLLTESVFEALVILIILVMFKEDIDVSEVDSVKVDVISNPDHPVLVVQSPNRVSCINFFLCTIKVLCYIRSLCCEPPLLVKLGFGQAYELLLAMVTLP